jgi:hypothetical protein
MNKITLLVLALFLGLASCASAPMTFSGKAFAEVSFLVEG